MEIDSSKSSSTDPMSIRVTSGGKIKSWVEVALKSLKENPDKPVVLHTLPNTIKRGPPASDPKNSEQQKDDDQKEVDDPDKDVAEIISNHQPSVSNIPRLVSVVEIIKREYLKNLPQSLLKSGLYQYNRIGSLEDVDTTQGSKKSPSEEERTQEILAALSGSNNLKIQKTPYIQTMLSVKPLEGIDSTWTYQEPLTQKLSRNARYRFKRRQQKDGEGDDIHQAMDTDGDT